tara:strand:- start:1933 stop:2241 length:309 start_codon:yes stop_codon:yes gene_type:complete
MQLRKGSRNKIIEIDGVGTHFVDGYKGLRSYTELFNNTKESVKNIEKDLMWVSMNPDGTPDIDEKPLFLHGKGSPHSPRERFNRHMATSRYPNKGLKKKYDL